MTILSWYVLKKFLRPFLVSFGALCILIFVAQLFDRLDRFLQDGVGWTHVVGFLLSSLPFQALEILPVACLLGTLFVVGQLSQTREYSAGLAGGIPPEKFLRGLFWGALLISLLALLSNETFIPPTTKYARTVFREKIRRLGDWRQEVIGDFFAAGKEGRLWNSKMFKVDAGTMDRAVVDTFENSLLKKQIDAQHAGWNSSEWIFYEGVERRFHADGVTIADTIPFTEYHSGYEEKPSDFALTEPEPEEMTYRQLKKHIHRLSALGVSVRHLQVELMMKLAFPFSCLIVTFLGIPLALKAQGGRAMGVAAAGILSLMYMGFVQFGKALAQHHIPPLLGAWLSNLVFIFLGFLLWYKMKKTA